MNKWTKIITCILIITVCISFDQITKSIAVDELSFSPPLSFMGNLFSIQLVKNNGAFLSIGSNWPYFFRLIFLILFPVLVIFSLCIVLLKSNKFDRLSIVSFSLILGGGISNLWDRLMNDGWVVDFMNLGIGDIRTGIFNFADVFIMIGLGSLLVSSFYEYRLKKLMD